MNYRTGIGYDVHRFAPGRKLMLGGIEVKHDREMEREFDERIKVAKAGDRQTLIMHERVD